MRSSLGETRSSIKRSHALICEDSHEVIYLPHWPGTEIVFYVSPAIGAGFSFFKVSAVTDTQVPVPPHTCVRFILLRSGRARVQDGVSSRLLEADHYAYLPQGGEFVIELTAGTEILCLERPYKPQYGVDTPGTFFSSLPAISPVPLRGDTGLAVQKLLPEAPGFDMEINVMNFAPGASLPYVETHFMEHGLMMLDGGGIYRLDENWYPVSGGDAIWMAPFCPQWFGALGQENARYLIYKNWNRDPLS